MSTNIEDDAKSKETIDKTNVQDSNLLSSILSDRNEKYKKSVEIPKKDNEEKVSDKKTDNSGKEGLKSESEPQKEVKKKTSDVPEKKEVNSKIEKKTNAPQEDEDDEDEKPEHVVALEKVNKRLSDANSWAGSINRKLKAGLKEIEELYEAGDIPENLFKQLSQTLKSDHPEPAPERLSKDKDPLNYLIALGASRLDDLEAAIGDDENFDHKANAFDFFRQNASPDEIREILNELSDLEDNPLKLARKMYSIGEKHYQLYMEAQEAGGMISLLDSKDKKIEAKQKKIDKLEKRLSQYEDYDKPTNRINELGLEKEPQPQIESGNLISQVLSERKAAMMRQ